MEIGFEVAKSAAERVTGVKPPILMRMILPGLLATAVVFPFVGRLLSLLPDKPEYLWQRVVAYALLELLIGALVSTAANQFTRVYTGRLFWPDLLRKWAVTRQQVRVDRLSRKADEASKAGDEFRYNEIWFELRQYPLKEETGKPYATHATQMGNILQEYDQYSWNRYGMDSDFYWGRIWLEVDKDKREEIENQWCLADGFVALSAISFAGAAIWLVQVILSWFGVGTGELPFNSQWWALAGVAGWLVLGYFWYRFSLPFHRANGELAKSVFDLYRHKIWNVTKPKVNEPATWRAAWGYLRYLVVRCPNCNNWTEVAREVCKTCSFGLAEIKRELEDNGRLPKG